MHVKSKLRFITLLTTFVLFMFTGVGLIKKPTWDENKSYLRTLLESRFRFQAPKTIAVSGNRGDRARALYYYVAGPPTTGYPTGETGPTRGLLGFFEDIISHPSVNRSFNSQGIVGCESLPTSGEMTVTGHFLGALSFSFSRGKKTVPAHFQDLPGTIYEKRIQIDENGFPLLAVELSCPIGATSLTGYMVLENGRRVEMYYQFDLNGNRRQLDVYMDHPAAAGNSFDEKLALRFESADGSEFDMWGVRTTNDPGEGSFAVAVKGDADNQQAQIALVEDADATPDDSTLIHTAPSGCVDLMNGVTTSGCDPIETPDATVQGSGFSVNQTDSIEVETIEVLRPEFEVYDFGAVEAGVTVDRIIQLSNLGTAAATSVVATSPSTSFSFKGGVYPGAGGTCGATIAAAASCTVVITYTAASVQEEIDNFKLDYVYNSLSYATLVGLRGSVAQNTSVAALILSEGEPYDFQTVPTGSMSSHMFTLTNVGAGVATAITASGLTAPMQFVGGTYPGTGGTCGATLAAGASCQLLIAYAPTVTGVTTDVLTIMYNDGAAAQSLSRTFLGSSSTLGSLAISDGPTYDFGAVVAGGSASHTFTLTNSGSGPATAVTGTLLAPFTYTGGAYPGTSGTCTATVGAGASCTLVVTFSPASVGVFSGQLQVSYNNGSSAQSLSRALNGQSTSPALLVISETDPYVYSATAVGATTAHTFVVTNVGGTIASVMNETGLTTPFAFVGGSYPGTGGTCGASLASGATCTMEVAYSPVATGAASSTITLAYNDGAAAQAASRSLQGTGLNAASLAISESDPYDYGTHGVGTSTSHTFTVTNAGGLNATAMTEIGLAAPFLFAGGAYPGTGGTCGVTLTAGASCTLAVAFSPVSTGAFSDTIDISYNDGSATQSATRAIQGTGAAPAVLTISDGPTYDFGTHGVGASVNHSFTVTNTGAVVAAALAGSGLAAPYTFSGGVYPGTGGTCGATLAAGANCTVVVTYAPTVTGVSNDTVEINYNDGGAAQQATRDVTGTATTAATLSLSGLDPIDFGTVPVGGSADNTVTVTNTGGSLATSLAGSGLTSPFSFKGGSYPGTGGTCAVTLAAGASCNMVINVSPVATGLATSTLSLAYFDGSAAQSVSKGYQATGTALAALVISESDPYDFGSHGVGVSNNHSFTLTNTGGTAATTLSEVGLAAPFTFVGGSYPGTGGTCGATLAAAANCTLVIDFTPASVGSFTDTIDISYNDGSAAQSATRSVQGAGVAPAVLTVSDGPTYDFGTSSVGSSLNHTFTVTNTGGVTATAMSGSGLAAPFSFLGGAYPGTGGTCTAVLAAGSSCMIVVQYAPVATGAASDAIDMNYNDGGAAQIASRNIQGTGVAPALLVISESDPYDFGSISTGSNMSHIFTVTNTGGITATTLSGSGLAAPYGFTGGSYPGAGGTCGAVLTAGSNCTVQIEFAPTVTGVATDTFDMNYNDGAAAQLASRALTGTGI